MPGYLLPDEPILSLDAYLATDTGGLGVQRAQQLGPEGTIDVITRSGLRGRGGGGFAYDEGFWRKRPDWTYDPAP